MRIVAVTQPKLLEKQSTNRNDEKMIMSEKCPRYIRIKKGSDIYTVRFVLVQVTSKCNTRIIDADVGLRILKYLTADKIKAR